MSKPLVVALGRAKISGVEITGAEEYTGSPIFIIPDRGTLRNVRLEVIGPNDVAITRKPGYCRTC
ncbi:hypothetical protein LCGC14_0331770 [marine sediment metagenome]|uniref:Uncharacterized protein n=1 Tax=marine sediment metagenome TaxID=412755 RepID=A0A0F9TZ02_9ZZZZ